MGSHDVSLLQGGQATVENLLNATDTMNFFKSKSAQKEEQAMD